MRKQFIKDCQITEQSLIDFIISADANTFAHLEMASQNAANDWDNGERVDNSLEEQTARYIQATWDDREKLNKVIY